MKSSTVELRRLFATLQGVLWAGLELRSLPGARYLHHGEGNWQPENILLEFFPVKNEPAVFFAYEILYGLENWKKFHGKDNFPING